MIQPIVAVTRGMVRLSSTLDGNASKAVIKRDQIRENMMFVPIVKPMTKWNGKKIQRKLVIKNAPDPS